MSSKVSTVDRLQKAGSFKMWRIIVNFWTLIFFTAIIFDFYNDNMLSKDEILLGVAGIYAAALAIYSAEKEFRRWHHMHKSLHPGELYVIIWTILMLFLIVGPGIYGYSYHLPSEVSASYIAMVSILAITRESKNFYKRKGKMKR
ncbi:MAG: hypothetical protein WCG02_04560 [Candidatus Taylorbacteria bacterium]